MTVLFIIAEKGKRDRADRRMRGKRERMVREIERVTNDTLIE